MKSYLLRNFNKKRRELPYAFLVYVVSKTFLFAVKYLCTKSAEAFKALFRPKILLKGSIMIAVDSTTQDKFIGDLVEQKQKVNVYLISGIKLIGIIKNFDGKTIRLDNETSSQLVFTQAISTILPNK